MGFKPFILSLHWWENGARVLYLVNLASSHFFPHSHISKRTSNMNLVCILDLRAPGTLRCAHPTVLPWGTGGIYQVEVQSASEQQSHRVSWEMLSKSPVMLAYLGIFKCWEESSNVL